MRTVFSKLATAAMLAGAVLTVSACGHSTAVSNTDQDANMSDMNTIDSSEGMTNDASAADSMGNVTDNSMTAGNDATPSDSGNSM